MAKVKKYGDVLMSAFHFQQRDLEANQQGQLTDWQMHRLKSARTASASVLALVLMAGVVGIAVGLGIWWSTPSPDAVFPLLVVLAMLAVFFIPYWFRNRWASADLHQRQVSVVEGRVSLSARSGSGRASTYRAQVEGERFTLRLNEMLALKNGDPYRIYYTARSHHVLSVEWLREDADDNLIDAPESAPLVDAPPDEAEMSKTKTDSGG